MQQVPLDLFDTAFKIGGAILIFVGAWYTTKFTLKAQAKEIEQIVERLEKNDHDDKKQWQKMDVLGEKNVSLQSSVDRLETILDPTRMNEFHERRARMEKTVEVLERTLDKLETTVDMLRDTKCGK